MKFLVFSDSHKYTNGIDRAIERHKDIRHILHCGDVSADVEYMQHVYGTTHTICSVCGNNDYSSLEPYVRILPIEGHRIYMSHGHREHVKQTLYTIAQAAKRETCDICVFGHTHVQLHDEQEGLILLNPGSIGYFRMEYAVLNVEKASVAITLYRL